VGSDYNVGHSFLSRLSSILKKGPVWMFWGLLQISTMTGWAEADLGDKIRRGMQRDKAAGERQATGDRTNRSLWKI
jgi:hypothetical protein